ncbi:MAG: type 2 lantipeptide synthetase LanM [Lachnospiraceae bacterium]|nr:type 2 lantipeptide synthetase LanM [Lachnospiraceae bacterium]
MIQKELTQARYQFEKHLSTNPQQILGDLSAPLSRAMDQTIRLFFEMLGELFSRIEQCKSEIFATFFDGKPFREICSISPDMGDLHNGGRSTSIIETEIGCFVYKPRDLSIDAAAYSLFKGFFNDFARIPLVLPKDGFGFCEYIRNEPADTEESAELYYHRLGGLCAVACVLGTRDFHKGNLLCSDAFPIPIDLEMLISPEKSKDTELTGLSRELAMTLYDSCLMPCRQENENVSFLFEESSKNASAPVINGSRRIVTFYRESFFKGFQTGYLRCKSQKEQLLHALDSFKGATIRHILRATQPYAVLLKKTYSPGWLQAPDLEEELLKTLFQIFEKTGEPTLHSLARAETRALLRGDIPYFYTKSDSLTLMGEDNESIANYFDKSAIQRAKERISNLCDSDLSFECALLQKAIEKMTPPLPITLLQSSHTLTKSDCIGLAEVLFGQILKDRVITPEGRSVWFSWDVKLDRPMHVMDSGFMNGYMGLAVFFAALSAVSPNDDVQKEATRILKYIIEQFSNELAVWETQDRLFLRQCDAGLTKGLAGQLFALYLIDTISSSAAIPGLYQRLIHLGEKLNLLYAKPDVISGLAGLIKALCLDDKIFSLPGAASLCESLSERLLDLRSLPYENKLLWGTFPSKAPISGIGHGQIGIGSALRAAGRRLSREDFLAAAQTAYDYEDAVYSNILNGWPDFRLGTDDNKIMFGYCSGGPGIGMDALMELEKVTEDAPNTKALTKLRLDRAIQSCLSQKLQNSDHLCCGNCASIEFLYEAGKRLHEPALTEEGLKRLSRMTQRAAQAGGYTCVGNEGRASFHPSLFYGTAGIGYELLKYACPDGLPTLFL